MPHQNTVFRDLLKLLPWHRFERLVEEHDADARVRRLSSAGQLVALLYGHVRLADFTETAIRRPDVLALCRRIEGSGDGDRDLLIIECKPGEGKSAVPDPPQIVQNECRGAYR